MYLDPPPHKYDRGSFLEGHGDQGCIKKWNGPRTMCSRVKFELWPLWPWEVNYLHWFQDNKAPISLISVQVNRHSRKQWGLGLGDIPDYKNLEISCNKNNFPAIWRSDATYEQQLARCMRAIWYWLKKKLIQFYSQQQFENKTKLLICLPPSIITKYTIYSALFFVEVSTLIGHCFLIYIMSSD